MGEKIFEIFIVVLGILYFLSLIASVVIPIMGNK